MRRDKFDPARCCASVAQPTRWIDVNQCQRKWKVERYGQRYCKQHDPVAVAERLAKATAKWKKEHAAAMEQWSAPKQLAKAREDIVCLRDALTKCEAALSGFLDQCDADEIRDGYKDFDEARDLAAATLHDTKPEGGTR